MRSLLPRNGSRMPGMRPGLRPTSASRPTGSWELPKEESRAQCYVERRGEGAKECRVWSAKCPRLGRGLMQKTLSY